MRTQRFDFRLRGPRSKVSCKPRSHAIDGPVVAGIHSDTEAGKTQKLRVAGTQRRPLRLLAPGCGYPCRQTKKVNGERSCIYSKIQEDVTVASYPSPRTRRDFISALVGLPKLATR